MRILRHTLLPDGSSDRVLLPILTWLLKQELKEWIIEENWADLRSLRNPPDNLTDRIIQAIKFYPCDLLFIHRDAEKEPHEKRLEEIGRALQKAKSRNFTTPAVCVIPVRMQEAWLLFDESAIRNAANNPNSKSRLQLPPLHQVETLPDPKAKLYGLLQEASGLPKRRLKHFRPQTAVHRIIDFIEDFSPLRQLQAFSALEYELQLVLKEQNWNTE